MSIADALAGFVTSLVVLCWEGHDRLTYVSTKHAEVSLLLLVPTSDGFVSTSMAP